MGVTDIKSAHFIKNGGYNPDAITDDAFGDDNPLGMCITDHAGKYTANEDVDMLINYDGHISAYGRFEREINFDYFSLVRNGQTFHYKGNFDRPNHFPVYKGDILKWKSDYIVHKEGYTLCFDGVTAPPTNSPTNSPTDPPTDSPTNSPTNSPTPWDGSYWKVLKGQSHVSV